MTMLCHVTPKVDRGKPAGGNAPSEPAALDLAWADFPAGPAVYAKPGESY